MAIEKLNGESFEAYIKSEKPVLVDFRAVWCGPCNSQGKINEALLAAHPEYSIAEVDIDESMELAVKYGIEAVPTMILFKNGAECTRFVGMRDANALIKAFEENK